MNVVVLCLYIYTLRSYKTIYKQKSLILIKAFNLTFNIHSCI